VNVRSSVQREVDVFLEPNERFDYQPPKGSPIVVEHITLTSGWNGWYLRARGTVRRKDGTIGVLHNAGDILWADIPAPIQVTIRAALKEHVLPMARQEWFT